MQHHNRDSLFSALKSDVTYKGFIKQYVIWSYYNHYIEENDIYLVYTDETHTHYDEILQAIVQIIRFKLKDNEDTSALLKLAEDTQSQENGICYNEALLPDASDELVSKYMLIDYNSGDSESWMRGWLFKAIDYKCFDRIIGIMRTMGIDIDEVFAYHMFMRHCERPSPKLEQELFNVCDPDKVEQILRGYPYGSATANIGIDLLNDMRYK